jgi:hypothetical protein
MSGTATCPECGAALVDDRSCQDIFYACLAQEFSDPAYGAVHNLTVPAYYLQHPSLLSRPGWEQMRATLAGFLVDGVSVGQMRQQAKVSLGSGQRDFSFRKGAPIELAGIAWARTIANIRLDDPEIYRTDILRWAQTVLDDSSQSASA